MGSVQISGYFLLKQIRNKFHGCRRVTSPRSQHSQRTDSSTGELTPMSPPTVMTGVTPFRVMIDPAGKFAYVANESGTISIYALDHDGTGALNGVPALISTKQANGRASV
jgi:hypothetical protein